MPRFVFPLALLLSALAPLSAIASQPEPITGRVYLDDGDTWFYGYHGHRTYIRPAGIDSPEKSQPCIRDGKQWFAGWDAGAWVDAFVHGRDVTCTPTGRKTYGRLVANCTVARPDGKPVDLLDAIVRAGWAVDYTHFSNGKYAEAEADAKAHHRGIWQGDYAATEAYAKTHHLGPWKGACMVPSAWRRKQK